MNGFEKKNNMQDGLSFTQLSHLWISFLTACLASFAVIETNFLVLSRQIIEWIEFVLFFSNMAVKKEYCSILFFHEIQISVLFLHVITQERGLEWMSLLVRQTRVI